MTPAAATPMIAVKGLTAQASGARALAHVDLQVARGECLGLAGAIGDSRATLLRILATLNRPASGVVEIDGLDSVTHVYAVRSRLAYAGRECLSGHGLRAREYLTFVCAARRRSTSSAQIAADVDRALARAQLPSNADVDGLAPGLRQRLALGAAFLTNARVMLLDDPFSLLDRAGHALFLDWLRELHDGGATIVIALNNEQDLDTLCRRVVRLEAGRAVPQAGHA